MDRKIRAVSYERVSSDMQAVKQSILAQADAVDTRLRGDESRVFLRRYQDEAFSGSLELHERPEGRRLLEDAALGLFDEVWVFKADRLGRDDIDPLVVKRTLERNGVRLQALHDNVDSPLEYAIKVAFAAEERRNIQLRTRAGMRAATSRGRYIGGPPSYGYRIEDRGGHPYLMPDDEVVFGDWTAADVACLIFRYVGVDHRTARSIAREFNRLGIPTSYARLSRGIRGHQTRNEWTPGRILQIVRNSTYRGLPTFGKRPNDKIRPPEIHYGNCPALVSEDLWQAAQEALAANRLITKNSNHISLLKSVMKCAHCGLTYCTSQGRPPLRWYRCNGYLTERGPHNGRCPAKAVKSTLIEPVVWGDIERFLRDPGPLLEELGAEAGGNKAGAVEAAERITLLAAIRDLETRRENALDMREHGHIDESQLASRLATIADEKAAIEGKLGGLETPEPESEPLDRDRLSLIGERLDLGLTDRERQEIVQLLVKKITIHTTGEGRQKEARAVIEYRFTQPGVVSTATGTGSSPPHELVFGCEDMSSFMNCIELCGLRKAVE